MANETCGGCGTLYVNVPECHLKDCLAEKVRILNLQNEEMRKALALMLEKVLSGTEYPHAFETCTAGYYPLDKCVTCGVQKMLGKGLTEKRNDPKGCICGPEGKCDYHTMTDVTAPINRQCWCAAKAECKDAKCPVHD